MLEKLREELDQINGLEDPTAEDLERREELMKLIAQEEQAVKSEERLHSEISFNVDGVDFTSLPADVIKLIQSVVLIDRKKILSEHDREVLELHSAAQEAARAAEEREAQLRRQNNDLQVKLAESEAAVLEKGHEIERLKLLLSDAESKRDAAAAEVEESKKEIDRLNKLVDEYQVAKVYGEREAQKIIKIEATEANDLQALIDRVASLNRAEDEKKKQEYKSSYIKVCGKEKLDLTGRQWRITHLNGEVQIVSGIDQAKYVIATEDEIEEARFRAEQDKLVAESVASDTALVEEPTFPVPTADESERVPGIQPEADGGNHSTDGKDVDEAGAKSLEARVAALEAKVFGYVKGVA